MNIASIECFPGDSDELVRVVFSGSAGDIAKVFRRDQAGIEPMLWKRAIEAVRDDAYRQHGEKWPEHLHGRESELAEALMGESKKMRPELFG